MRRIFRLIAMGTALVFMYGGAVQAVLIAADNFDYSGTYIKGQGGGYGWGTNQWAGTGNSALSSTSLSFAGLPSIGGSIGNITTGSTSRTFSTPLDCDSGATYYLGLFLNKSDTASMDVIFRGGTLDRWRMRWGATEVVAFGVASATATTVGTYSFTNTLFVVMKYDASAGTDTISIKVFLPGDTISEPVTWDATTTGINSLLLDNFRITGNVAGGKVDAIRIGTTFQDVVTEPPSTGFLCSLLAVQGNVVYKFPAKDTLTPVELNHGDSVQFTLTNGQVRTLELEDSSAEILEQPDGLPGIVYRFNCRLRVDGQILDMQRYVCTQETFYEPVVINGLRIWFDMALDVFRKIPMRDAYTGNRWQPPHKDARFALQDATLRICPQETQMWYSNTLGRISIESCYNGEDCWMGPYMGESCHGGLDINDTRGNPLWAPIDFDDQWLWNSLAAGDDNNRWRGIRIWPNGDVWALQSHHLITLNIPEHTPLTAGTKYADTAGVKVGLHPHTHYEFKVAKSVNGLPPDFDQGESIGTKKYTGTGDPLMRQPDLIHLDPWIMFWQIFEDERDRNNAMRAHIAPLSPARTGVPVNFSGEASRKSVSGGILKYHWSFGDGSGAYGAAPVHIFSKPGIYPVTLVIDDGSERAAFTQHLTVDGEPVAEPALGMQAPDEFTFITRPRHMMDTYAQPVTDTPFAIKMTARSSRPVPNSRDVTLVNLGGGQLASQASCVVTYNDGGGWLTAEPVSGTQTVIRVTADASSLTNGTYTARVSVSCSGALNSPQYFTVQLDVPETSPATSVAVDDESSGFSCTPYFWVGHRFAGRVTNYRTNGGRTNSIEIARFTPDLAAGSYNVSFSSQTPFVSGTRFNVRIRCHDGEQMVRVEPAISRIIGRFNFDEGADGFVEILAEGSEGLVMADEVIFEKVIE